MKTISVSFDPCAESGHVSTELSVKFYNQIHHDLRMEFHTMLDNCFRAQFNRTTEGRIGAHRIDDPALALYMLDRIAYEAEFDDWYNDEVYKVIRALNNGEDHTIGDISGEERFSALTIGEVD